MLEKNKCIDAARVPCEKARDYLRKKGLLCEAPTDEKPPEKIPKKRKKKGLFEKWFA
jgi:hypothetical protein